MLSLLEITIYLFICSETRLLRWSRPVGIEILMYSSTFRFLRSGRLALWFLTTIHSGSLLFPFFILKQVRPAPKRAFARILMPPVLDSLVMA